MTMSDSFTLDDFYADAEGGEADAIVDDAPAADTAITDGADPADGGQVEATDEPTANYLDPTQYTDHLVRVKVNGEEVDVPLAEALQGYQRQADYTQKTQEIAFWKRVDEAMKVDPQKTFEFLAQQFGVQLGAPQPQANDDDDWGFDETDPVDAKIAAFQQQLAPALQFFEQQQAQAEIERHVTALTQKYSPLDPEFNAQEVVAHAVNNMGITDPSLLEIAYKDLFFQKQQARAAAGTLHQQQTQQGNAQRQAAAAQAAAAITAGASASGGRAAADPEYQPKTIQEAIALARQELSAI